QVEAMVMLEIGEHVVDGGAIHRHRAIAEAPVDVENRGAETLAKLGHQCVVSFRVFRAHRGSFIFSTISCRRGRPCVATGSVSMRCCSFRMASRTASGRGGQPGMNTSTGMIWSMPCTVA